MQNYSILLIDDSPVIIMALTEFMKESELSLTILRANSGKLACSMAEEKLPDLIITDWEMPEMDGIETIKALKNNEQTKDIPIIMCTGKMTKSENLKTALRAGAVDFIRKPVDKIELIARVNSMLTLSESYKKIKTQVDEIAAEKDKTEKLLLNTLPKKIVSDLKKFGKTEPELFQNVSVFFSDIICFTEISNNLEPKVLISELNQIFTEFDNIMEKYSCERIKTIGDAYLAVCGMPTSNTKHAENIINSAIEIINFLKLRNKTEKYKWEIRIGIHSGPVIGAVVGIKKYIYDVFGPTINIASRMESNSEAMKINLSETTRKLTIGKFLVEERKPIEVKGIGLTKMYFLKVV
jgi:class 3 adenylate cyclase/CheY-like chemotaxis protein